MRHTATVIFVVSVLFVLCACSPDPADSTPSSDPTVGDSTPEALVQTGTVKGGDEAFFFHSREDWEYVQEEAAEYGEVEFTEAEKRQVLANLFGRINLTVLQDSADVEVLDSDDYAFYTGAEGVIYKVKFVNGKHTGKTGWVIESDIDLHD